MCSNIEHTSVLNMIKCSFIKNYKIIKVDSDGILKWANIK